VANLDLQFLTMTSQSSGQPCALRLGTRGSQLARWQAEWVASELRRLGHAVELVEIATHGDVDGTRPVEEIGTRGVFTKAIQQALLADEVDLAVHSLKDLPTEPVAGLTLAAVPKRESAADVLVLGRGSRVEGRGPDASAMVSTLPWLSEGARVGTASLRRQAQLLHRRPDLRVSEVRGNVDTRLRKLDEGQFDAIVLAEAGLRRLGLAGRISQVMPFEIMLPAVGQGALGIECRAGDDATLATLRTLDDADTHTAVTAERAMLHRLRGGCMAPVGAMGVAARSLLRLRAAVLNPPGTRRIDASEIADVLAAEAIGRRVAEALLAQGAAELIEEARGG
jgi:hydroxymethylbilane synthase